MTRVISPGYYYESTREFLALCEKVNPVFSLKDLKQVETSNEGNDADLSAREPKRRAPRVRPSS